MQRIQRKRTKGWKMPENTKYVGRPTKFGNPFRLDPDGFIECYSTNRLVLDPWILWSATPNHSMNDIVELYEIWITGGLQKIAPYLPTPPDVQELKGKNLACFCSLSKPCHVDVLLEILK